jgi:hypothetical protein
MAKKGKLQFEEDKPVKKAVIIFSDKKSKITHKIKLSEINFEIKFKTKKIKELGLKRVGKLKRIISGNFTGVLIE